MTMVDSERGGDKRHKDLVRCKSPELHSQDNGQSQQIVNHVEIRLHLAHTSVVRPYDGVF